MKELYGNILQTHKNLFDMQKKLIVSLSEMYPTITTVRGSELLRDINEEMQFLLSNCLKYKTGKFKIKYDPKQQYGYDNVLILTKSSPGLRRPHTTGYYVDLWQVKEIFRGDLKVKNNYHNSDVRTVRLNVMKNSSKVNPERFAKFYEFLRRMMEINEKTLKGKEDYDDRNIVKRASKDKRVQIEITLDSFRFRVAVEKPGDYDDYHGAFDWNDIAEMPDSSQFSFDRHVKFCKLKEEKQKDMEEEIEEENEEQEMHVKGRNYIFQNWIELDNICKIAEDKKKALLTESQQLYDDILDYLKPIKILKKLT